MTDDQKFMLQAIQQARLAFEKNEVPVGAVIVHEGNIIARAYNQVELLKDPTAHAEMIAITQATHFLSTKWLEGCSLYVTVEPCSMCAGAIVLARIKRLCFGAWDKKAGACGSVLDIVRHPKLNHCVHVVPDVLPDICGDLMSQFFKAQRLAGKK